jgi:hypothetical protein
MSAPAKRLGLAAPLFFIDELIRRGRTGKARAELKRFCARTLPRASWLPAASLARRLELPELGLRLLHPAVRPLGKKVTDPATPEEVAEYAANLVRVGAPLEALELLDAPRVAKIPESYLYRAFARVSLWDYAGSLEPLETFLRFPGLDPYQRLVARVNHAAALVFERDYARADRMLGDLEKEMGEQNYHLLLGNVLKLRAQVAVGRREPDVSAHWLERAQAHMREAGQWDHLFLKKWRAVREVFVSPKKAVAALAAVRDEAERAKHWETVRDCEGYLAVATGDETRLWQVYFGTPFASFRKKLLQDFGHEGKVPESFARGAKRGKIPADLTGRAGLGPDLVPGDARFRLLRTLASDGYRPFRSAALFQLVFPGEHYNPLTSPPRVRMLILRLRKALTKQKLGLDVESDEGGYRLVVRRPILVSLEPAAESRTGGLADRAAAEFGAKPFSISQGAKKLGTSERSLLRALSEALTRGRLVREGKGRAVRYRFVS